jgi:hypothetical protein
MEHMGACRVELLHEWRDEDMRQTTLDNANFLWDRFVARNINDLVGLPVYPFHRSSRMKEVFALMDRGAAWPPPSLQVEMYKMFSAGLRL